MRLVIICYIFQDKNLIHMFCAQHLPYRDFFCICFTKMGVLCSVTGCKSVPIIKCYYVWLSIKILKVSIYNSKLLKNLSIFNKVAEIFIKNCMWSSMQSRYIVQLNCSKTSVLFWYNQPSVFFNYYWNSGANTLYGFADCFGNY